MHGVAPQCAVKEARPSLGGEAGGRSPGFISFILPRTFHGGGSGGARSQIVLNNGVLAALCDPILDRVPTYRATHQVAALHEAIEGYADIQFANIAPARTGTS
jgi:hypothetical protein